MHLFLLKDVIIEKTVASTSKGKQRSRKSVKSFVKMNLKVISFKSCEESGAQVRKTERPIEGQKEVKKKKNAKVKSSAGSEDPPKATKSFLLPMPYNEKLRLGGRENSRAIAETQRTTVQHSTSSVCLATSCDQHEPDFHELYI